MTPSNREPVLVVKGPEFARHLDGVFHLENPKRVAAFETVLQDPSLDGGWRQVHPRPASFQELALIHTQDYVRQVAETAGVPLFAFDLDTQTTADSFETARLAVGGIFSLLDAIMEGSGKRGFAFIRPPGHHAEPDRAMGFCLFNNTALGAAYLKERYGVTRIMILDIDAHHGNGIQTAFYDTNEVLYLSTHLFPGFPGTGKLGEVGSGIGEGYTVNVPMGPGQGDNAFARVVYHLALPLAAAFRPEIILVPCGFDLYVHDRMGGMSVTPDGYALLTSLLVYMAETVCQGRIAFIMEGGYSMRGIRECGLRVMMELCGVSTLNGKQIDRVKKSTPSRFSVLRKAMEVHKKYWSVLGQ